MIPSRASVDIPMDANKCHDCWRICFTPVQSYCFGQRGYTRGWSDTNPPPWRGPYFSAPSRGRESITLRKRSRRWWHNMRTIWPSRCGITSLMASQCAETHRTWPIHPANGSGGLHYESLYSQIFAISKRSWTTKVAIEELDGQDLESTSPMEESNELAEMERLLEDGLKRLAEKKLEKDRWLYRHSYPDTPKCSKSQVWEFSWQQTGLECYYRAITCINMKLKICTFIIWRES